MRCFLALALLALGASSCTREAGCPGTVSCRLYEEYEVSVCCDPGQQCCETSRGTRSCTPADEPCPAICTSMHSCPGDQRCLYEYRATMATPGTCAIDSEAWTSCVPDCGAAEPCGQGCCGPGSRCHLGCCVIAEADAGAGDGG